LFKRLNSYRRGYTLAWNKYSKTYRRNNPWCVKCLPKLTAAQCVDHIKPISGKDDPLFWEESNHQSLCWSCHSIKTATEDGSGGAVTHPAWLPKPACPVTVVCGPPGSGKSTYVKGNIAGNDTLIDLDACLETVSGITDAPKEYLTPAIRMRNRMLANLAKQRHGSAWFIVSAPTKRERDWWAAILGATVINLDVPIKECERRIKTDTHRQGRLEALTAWHKKATINDWKPPRKKVTIGLDGWPIGETDD